MEQTETKLPCYHSRIFTPYLNYVGASCVRFAYYMLGVDIDELNLFLQIGDNRRNVWTKEGEQGTVWHTDLFDRESEWLTAAVDVDLTYGTRVSTFQRVRFPNVVFTNSLESGCPTSARNVVFNNKLESEWPTAAVDVELTDVTSVVSAFSE